MVACKLSSYAHVAENRQSGNHSRILLYTTVLALIAAWKSTKTAEHDPCSWAGTRKVWRKVTFRRGKQRGTASVVNTGGGHARGCSCFERSTHPTTTPADPPATAHAEHPYRRPSWRASTPHLPSSSALHCAQDRPRSLLPIPQNQRVRPPALLKRATPTTHTH